MSGITPELGTTILNDVFEALGINRLTKEQKSKLCSNFLTNVLLHSAPIIGQKVDASIKAEKEETVITSTLKPEPSFLSPISKNGSSAIKKYHVKKSTSSISTGTNSAAKPFSQITNKRRFDDDGDGDDGDDGECGTKKMCYRNLRENESENETENESNESTTTTTTYSSSSSGTDASSGVDRNNNDNLRQTSSMNKRFPRSTEYTTTHSLFSHTKKKMDEILASEFESKKICQYDSNQQREVLESIWWFAERKKIFENPDMIKVAMGDHFENAFNNNQFHEFISFCSNDMLPENELPSDFSCGVSLCFHVQELHDHIQFHRGKLIEEEIEKKVQNETSEPQSGKNQKESPKEGEEEVVIITLQTTDIDPDILNAINQKIPNPAYTILGEQLSNDQANQNKLFGKFVIPKFLHPGTIEAIENHYNLLKNGTIETICTRFSDEDWYLMRHFVVPALANAASQEMSTPEFGNEISNAIRNISVQQERQTLFQQQQQQEEQRNVSSSSSSPPPPPPPQPPTSNDLFQSMKEKIKLIFSLPGVSFLSTITQKTISFIGWSAKRIMQYITSDFSMMMMIMPIVKFLTTCACLFFKYRSLKNSGSDLIVAVAAEAEAQIAIMFKEHLGNYWSIVKFFLTSIKCTLIQTYDAISSPYALFANPFAFVGKVISCSFQETFGTLPFSIANAISKSTEGIGFGFIMATIKSFARELLTSFSNSACNGIFFSVVRWIIKITKGPSDSDGLWGDDAHSQLCFLLDNPLTNYLKSLLFVSTEEEDKSTETSSAIQSPIASQFVKNLEYASFVNATTIGTFFGICVLIASLKTIQLTGTTIAMIVPRIFAIETTTMLENTVSNAYQNSEWVKSATKYIDDKQLFANNPTAAALYNRMPGGEFIANYAAGQVYDNLVTGKIEEKYATSKEGEIYEEKITKPMNEMFSKRTAKDVIKFLGSGVSFFAFKIKQYPVTITYYATEISKDTKAMKKLFDEKLIDPKFKSAYLAGLDSSATETLLDGSHFEFFETDLIKNANKIFQKPANIKNPCDGEVSSVVLDFVNVFANAMANSRMILSNRYINETTTTTTNEQQQQHQQANYSLSSMIREMGYADFLEMLYFYGRQFPHQFSERPFVVFMLGLRALDASNTKRKKGFRAAVNLMKTNPSGLLPYEAANDLGDLKCNESDFTDLNFQLSTIQYVNGTYPFDPLKNDEEVDRVEKRRISHIKGQIRGYENILDRRTLCKYFEDYKANFFKIVDDYANPNELFRQRETSDDELNTIIIVHLFRIAFEIFMVDKGKSILKFKDEFLKMQNMIAKNRNIPKYTTQEYFSMYLADMINNQNERGHFELFEKIKSLVTNSSIQRQSEPISPLSRYQLTTRYVDQGYRLIMSLESVRMLITHFMVYFMSPVIFESFGSYTLPSELRPQEDFVRLWKEKYGNDKDSGIKNIIICCFDIIESFLTGKVYRTFFAIRYFGCLILQAFLSLYCGSTKDLGCCDSKSLGGLKKRMQTAISNTSIELVKDSAYTQFISSAESGATEFFSMFFA